MNKNYVLPISIILCGLLISTILIWSGTKVSQPTDLSLLQGNLRKVDLQIDNMFCVGCRASVVGSVMALPGVIQADADPSTDSGWVVYDPEIITKEQIVDAPIFDAYNARILSDQIYSNAVQQAEAQTIPPEIEQKLNALAQKLQEREQSLDQFSQQELDDAIKGGYWDKVDNLLNNLLTAYN